MLNLALFGLHQFKLSFCWFKLARQKQVCASRNPKPWFFHVNYQFISFSIKYRTSTCTAFSNVQNY